MAATKDLTVRLLGDATQFSKAMKGASNDLTHLGKKMTSTITPAAAAVAVGLSSVGSSWNDARDAIVVGTGASGKALDGLLESTKRVAGQVPNDFGQVGTAIADFNTRLGLTGPELEEVSEQALNLSRITGTDVSANIRTVSRVMKDWGIDTSETSSTMDMLFKASQSTGIEVGRLGDTMVQFGAPLRQIGFSVEETTALLAGFEAQGVNTELVMGGLRQSLGRMARAGEDPISTFQRVTEEIKNAGSAGEANALALELFGARAGPDMAAAIREGRFEIGDLVADLSNSEGTIQSAADGTLRLSDRFDILKNKITGVLGPFGEVGGVAFGAVAAIGPLIFGLGQMAPLLIKVKNGFIALKTVMLGHPILLLATVAIGVGTALAMMGGNADGASAAIDGMADSMFEAQDAGEGLANWLADFALDTPVFTAAMDKAGVTITEVTDAALAGGPAWDAMAAKLAATSGEVAKNDIESKILAATLKELPGAASEANAAMEQRARVDDTAAVAAEGAAAATEELGTTQVDAAASAEMLAQSQQAVREAFAEVLGKIDELTAAQGELVGAEVDLERSSLAYSDAMVVAAEVTAKNAVGTREHTEGVLDAKDALIDRAKALTDDTVAQYEAAGATITAQQENEILAGHYRDLANYAIPEAAEAARGWADDLDAIPDEVIVLVEGDTGEARQQARDYIIQLGGIPKSTETMILALIDQGRIADAERALNNAARDRTATIRVQVTGGSGDQLIRAGQVGIAHGGGMVTGGGSTGIKSFAGLRDDEVPAVLQKGEAILTKGQQAAIGGGMGDHRAIAREMAREFAKTLQHERRAI